MYFDNPKVLDLVKRELDRTIVCYDKEKMNVFLLAMSYKLKQPSNVILVGPSSAGKSYILNNIMKYFPVTTDIEVARKEGMGLILTGISAKALNRFKPPGDTWDNKLLCVQELDGASEAGPVLRTFMSEGQATTMVTEKGQYGNFTKVWTIKGTPAFFVTTANDSIEQQFANRCNVIEVSGEFVPDVLRFVSGKYVNMDLYNTKIDLNLRKEIMALPKEDWVFVPYAQAISSTWYTDTVVAQRSFPEFMKLIQCIALCHKKFRKKHDGYIVANMDDYEIARRIAKISKFKLGAGLLKAYTKVIRAVKSEDPRYIHPLKAGGSVIGVTREQLSELIERSIRQIDRYLEELCDMGILKTHLRWIDESDTKSILRAGRNPNVYSLALKTEEDIAFPSSRQLLRTRADLTRLNFRMIKDKWELSEKEGIPCTFHAYDPLTGKDININEDETVYMVEGKRKTIQSPLYADEHGKV